MQTKLTMHTASAPKGMSCTATAEPLTALPIATIIRVAAYLPGVLTYLVICAALLSTYSQNWCLVHACMMTSESRYSMLDLFCMYSWQWDAVRC